MIINCETYASMFAKHSIPHASLHKSRNFFRSWLGRVTLFFHFPFFNNINPIQASDSKVIVFDGGIKHKRVLEIIKKSNPGKRLIFYYWNPVSESIAPAKIPDGYEVWSYSKYDAQKYGLRFNPTFTFAELFDTEDSANAIYDLVFIGKDKGRKKDLLHIRRKSAEAGLKSVFIITANHPRFQTIGYSRPLPYVDVLKMDRSSKSILDYYSFEKAGFSLRLLEAIFLNKVLVTNNSEILSDPMFVGKPILSLAQLSASSFAESVKRPAIYEDDIKSFFCYETWIRRFDIC